MLDVSVSACKPTSFPISADLLNHWVAAALQAWTIILANANHKSQPPGNQDYKSSQLNGVFSLRPCMRRGPAVRDYSPDMLLLSFFPEDTRPCLALVSLVPLLHSITEYVNNHTALRVMDLRFLTQGNQACLPRAPNGWDPPDQPRRDGRDF